MIHLDRSMSIVFLLLFLLSYTSSVLSTKHDEIMILKMKKQLGNPDILRNWTKGFDVCGIQIYDSQSLTRINTKCTNTGRINSLTMNYIKNVSAPFPDAICGLTKLEELEIYMFPGLYGPIPCCITKLANLSSVTIRGTSVSGSVPSFSNNTKLNSINLVSNHLSGTIPPCLSTLPNLRFLGLSDNHLTGTIPPRLVPNHSPSPFSPMLWLDHNNLTGEIPKSYGLVDFFYINIGYNQLSGDASFLFGKQKNTTEILMNNNDFEFDLSNVEFSDKLNSVDLSHNKIYGNVPEFIASSTELSYFYVAFNRLCGELPKGFNMWRFSEGDFENNACLCGNPLPPCFNSAPAPAPTLAPALAPAPESTTP